VAVSVLLLPSLASWKSASAEEAKDSCVECHGKTSFFVTNKKLYSYFQRWRFSNHTRAGVTCADCHGGNPQSSDKDTAHGGDLNAAQASSAVNFRNIPKTCGRCHQDIYGGFRESAHFEHLVSKDQEGQGPTCVTCHGSMNMTVLNAYTVEETCRRCHNKETQNHPENPREARALLRRLLSIQRYYHYIQARGAPATTKSFLKDVDAHLHDLTVTWHTFDLDAMDERTKFVLEELREKRQEVVSAGQESGPGSRGQPPK
jgi:nitrate/TMAO reductase-like tetraheme cytochrome c subunit